MLWMYSIMLWPLKHTYPYRYTWIAVRVILLACPFFLLASGGAVPRRRDPVKRARHANHPLPAVAHPARPAHRAAHPRRRRALPLPPARQHPSRGATASSAVSRRRQPVSAAQCNSRLHVCVFNVSCALSDCTRLLFFYCYRIIVLHFVPCYFF